MITKDFTVNIDFQKDLRYDRIAFVRGDIQSNKISLNLFKSGIPVDLTNTEVKITFIRPDGGSVFVNADITDIINGKAEYLMANSVIDVTGRVAMYVSLHGLNDERLTSSVVVYFEVVEDPADLVTQDIMADDRYPFITQMLNEEEVRKANELTRITNEDGRVTAENTRITNEDTRISNETTRQTHETARVNNETIRQTNETTRENNEAGRIIDESDRATAEGLRVANESTRQTNESTRQTNETTRETNEGVRGTNEVTRQGNEDNRVTAEIQRETNETTRESQESTRQGNETIRESNESTRITSENDRVTEESTRVSNEQTREANETDRITSEGIRETNETTRAGNETVRVDNETTRETNEVTRQSNESTREANELIRQQQESDREATIAELTQAQHSAIITTSDSMINIPAEARMGDMSITQKGNTIVDPIKGLISTIPKRVKVVGKNLFDGLKEYGGYVINTGEKGTASFFSIRNKNHIRVKGSTTYSITNNYSYQTLKLYFYDEVGNFISAVSSSPTTFTTPANATFLNFVIEEGFMISIDIDVKIQLEEGMPTGYEDYTGTERYGSTSVILQSLPNGTSDEEGIKRISDIYTLTTNDVGTINTNYTNVDLVRIGGPTFRFDGRKPTNDNVAEGFVLFEELLDTGEYQAMLETTLDQLDNIENVGKYLYLKSGIMYFVIPKGMTQEEAQTKYVGMRCVYLLAFESYREFYGSYVKSIPNGTIFLENSIKHTQKYGTGIALPLKLKNTKLGLIQSIVKLDEVEKTSINVLTSNVTIVDNYNFTITGALPDDVYEIVYEHGEDTTNATIDYSYPLNLAGEFESLGNTTFKTNEDLRQFMAYQNAVNIDFDLRLTTLEP